VRAHDDHRDDAQVLTPANVLATQLLAQCRVRSPGDLMRGLWLCSWYLSAQVLIVAFRVQTFGPLPDWDSSVVAPVLVKQLS
jgi:hypothetical protein